MNRFLKLAVPGVQQLTPYQPGKPVEELERELGLQQSIKLASNENPIGPSSKAVAAVQEVIGRVNAYPDGSGFKLTSKLAEKHGVVRTAITLGNGSNDVLELIARAFLAPCYNAVFSEYAFAVYPIITQAIGAEARVARAFPADHPTMPYGHDLDAILSMINPATRVVFIANPNNPTGTWLDLQQLDAFLQAVDDEVIVVLDEAYYEYMPDSLKPASEALIQRFPNLVITRTFSKIYGLAGLRIGYGISSPDLADFLNRVRQPFNTSLPAQVAALAALDDDEHIASSIAMNQAGLAQLRLGLDKLGLQSIPSIANFIAVDFKRDALPIYNDLLRQGIILRPLANYKMPHHLRITIGTEQQNQRLLSSLEQVL
ncbi:MAG: histidinol-phosphate transaminase [Gammaproteobacteria bacterium]|nr:histidinol-phosphate transaminase [Gammaproteobacteria bacterium]